MARMADLAVPFPQNAHDTTAAPPFERETLVCGVHEHSARETMAFAAALARSRGWRLALCPLPSGRTVREQLDALVSAASREDAALAVAPRSHEPGWVDAFLEVSATAPCPLVAVPPDANSERCGRFDRSREAA
jgi:hypothetical protein